VWIHWEVSGLETGEWRVTYLKLMCLVDHQQGDSSAVLKQKNVSRKTIRLTTR